MVLQARRDKLKKDAELVKDKIENPKKYYKPIQTKVEKTENASDRSSSRSEELQRTETAPKEVKEVPVFVQRPKSAKTVGVSA